MAEETIIIQQEKKRKAKDMMKRGEQRKIKIDMGKESPKEPASVSQNNRGPLLKRQLQIRMLGH